MKKQTSILYLLLMIFLITNLGYAQANTTSVKQIKKGIKNMESLKASEGRILFKRNGKYGYLDYKGNIVIKPQYKYANSFEYGIAKVYKKDFGYHYINKKGEKLFTFEEIEEKTNSKYSIKIEEFNEGLAKIKDYNRIGYINTKGEIVIPVIYTSGREFSNGLVYVRDKNGKYYVNQSGEKIITISKDDNNYYYDFKEGLAKFYSRDNKTYGFINQQGEVEIKSVYDYVKNFSEGYAVFRQGTKRGVINKQGEVVIKAKFKKISDFKNGIFFVYDGVYTTFLNHDLKPIYQLAGYFNHEYTDNYITLEYTKGIRIIDKNGHLVSDYLQADSIGDRFLLEKDQNLIRVTNLVQKTTQTNENISIYKEYSYRFIDKMGKEVLKLDKYDQVFSFSEGRAKVKKNNLYGFINKSGQEVIPIKYSLAKSFKNGKAVVKDSKRTYYINKQGKEIKKSKNNNQNSQPQEEDPYQGSTIIMKKQSYYNKSYGLVNKDNELILKPIYDSIKKEDKGIYRIKKDRKYGFYSIKNNQLVKPIYNYIRFMSTDDSNYMIAKKSDYGVINSAGEEIVPFNYDYIRITKNDFIHLWENKKEGLMSRKGNWILKPKYYKLYINKIHNTKDYLLISYQDGDQRNKLIINKNTNKKINLDNNSIIYGYSNGIFLGKNKNLNLYINSQSDIIHSTKAKLYYFESKYGMASLANGDIYLIDKSGTVYLKDSGYDHIYQTVKNDQFVFSKDGSYGISDIEGNIKTKRKYNCISKFKHGIASACFNGKDTYINSEGEEIVKLGEYVKTYPFSDGLGLALKIKK